MRHGTARRVGGQTTEEGQQKAVGWAKAKETSGAKQLVFCETLVTQLETFEIEEGNSLRSKRSWRKPEKETWDGEDCVPQTAVWSSPLPDRLDSRVLGQFVPSWGTNADIKHEEGEEKVHTYVQCKHGFALISGERDFSLKPACFKKTCVAEGKRWLQMEGVLDPKRNGETFRGNSRSHQCSMCQSATHASDHQSGDASSHF